MVDIIVALSMHPNLQCLSLKGNQLGIKGCIALATLLQCSATELKDLNISDNQMIDDEGIEVLVPALKKTALEGVIIGSNLITTRGWESLATVLVCPNSNLTDLSISHNNLDEQVVDAFSKALADNHTLRGLILNGLQMSACRLQSFTKMLCDTSSVNSTFMSNHTLLGVYNPNRITAIEHLLAMNRKANKKEVAIIKILRHHEEFDMQPFFEWEFKCLPLVVNWLEKASLCNMPRGFEPNIEKRKLSTVYQFVRGMPLLYVEACLKKQLEDVKAKEKQMEDERLQMEEEQLQMEKAKLALQREELMLCLKMQEFSQRKQSVEDHKRSIMKKLGQKLS